MPTTDLTELLACPRCDAVLVEKNAALRCKGCSTDYPSLAGLPFLFAEPDVALDEWRQRYHARLRDIEQQVAQLDERLAGDDLIEPARDRLAHMRAAFAAHRDELADILSPLDMLKLAADHTTYLALRTRIPGDQGIFTYHANLHRDWCWGDDENEQSAALVADAIGDGGPGKLLVLGAGGGRLAYDLHQRFDHGLTVALDFNPLLMIAGARVAAGEGLAMHEFPLAPPSGKEFAVQRTLSAPAKAREGLHWILGNALRAPFRPATFDTLVTPWLCDVVDEPLTIQAARWNRLLPEGGRWIWFGSHVFRDADLADRLGIEESMAIIEKTGFSKPTLVEAEIPYLNSPSNRHLRRERVVVMSMTKVADVEAPHRHVALPDWLVRDDLPIPANESFRVQGLTTRIHAFFFSMVDGKRTLEDMATLMEQERLMPKDEGIATLRNFMIRALEESEGYSTF